MLTADPALCREGAMVTGREEVRVTGGSGGGGDRVEGWW